MAKIIFWVSLITILYVYFGYSALCILISVFFGKKTPKNRSFHPKLAIIVPCYNEEKIIKAKIENILSLNYPKDRLQIMIASESNDSTNSIAAAYKESGVELYIISPRAGKPTILFKTIPYARSEIVVFSDANAMFAPDALLKIAENFSDPTIGAVIGALNISNITQSSISRGEHLYKQYETLIRKANSRLGRVLNADGSIFALRKDLYSPISAERGDDFELILRILLNGHRCIFEPEAVSYEEASITAKAEILRKIRMVSWFLKSSLILAKEMIYKFRIDLLFQLVSHKILRWFMPYFFIALFSANCSLIGRSLFFKLSLLVQLSIYFGGLAGLYITQAQKNKPPVLLGALYYFIIYNYAFLIGTLKGILSRQISSSWEKVRS
jgi:cellulose synthase/poly-beta-1,6-N-acetylglucosamine synthase-like glycosyltransferase